MTEPQRDRKKILVVDDEPHVLAYLETLLQDNGYDTICAPNGKEGLDMLRRERPDLVILDLMMPRQTGTDLYRRLVQDREIADTPVIVVSAVPGRHLAVKNPFAIFDKPIDPGAFLDAVARAIGER